MPYRLRSKARPPNAAKSSGNPAGSGTADGGGGGTTVAVVKLMVCVVFVPGWKPKRLKPPEIESADEETAIVEFTPLIMPVLPVSTAPDTSVFGSANAMFDRA